MRLRLFHSLPRSVYVHIQAVLQIRLPALYIPTTYFIGSYGRIIGEAAVGARDADAYEELVDSILQELDEN